MVGSARGERGTYPPHPGTGRRSMPQQAVLDNYTEALMVSGRTNPYTRRWDPRTQELYYEHRAVAAWRLGRPLRPGEVVHHLDGDPTNNHPDNLVVLPSQRHHALMTHYLRREAGGVQHLFSLDELFSAITPE